MKQIKVQDDVHAKLMAMAEYRNVTAGAMIDILMQMSETNSVQADLRYFVPELLEAIEKVSAQKVAEVAKRDRG